jgi:hypothetical protein
MLHIKNIIAKKWLQLGGTSYFKTLSCSILKNFVGEIGW